MVNPAPSPSSSSSTSSITSTSHPDLLSKASPTKSLPSQLLLGTITDMAPTAAVATEAPLSFSSPTHGAGWTSLSGRWNPYPTALATYNEPVPLPATPTSSDNNSNSSSSSSSSSSSGGSHKRSHDSAFGSEHSPRHHDGDISFVPASTQSKAARIEKSSPVAAGLSGSGKCYRHASPLYMMESEQTRHELQLILKSLPPEDSQVVNSMWSMFASVNSSNRLLILRGLVNLCCIPQLSYLNQTVPKLLRIDFIASSPPEIAFKILSYLDAKSLCVASQVSRCWAQYANDDYLWHRLCVQHINKMCKSCGWGLPLLDKTNRKLVPILDATVPASLLPPTSTTTAAASSSHHSTEPAPSITTAVAQWQPPLAPAGSALVPRLGLQPPPNTKSIPSTCNPAYVRDLLQPVAGDQCTNSGPALPMSIPRRRPWKVVYAERQIIANNWRKFRYQKRTFQDHSDGVLCMQCNDQFLITGCYDGIVNVRDIETGEIVQVLRGHTAPVRTLQFDDCKLFTGSLDGTVKIWCYHSGLCVRTLTAFENTGVISLAYRGRILCVGGQSGELRVFDTAKGTVFTLPGHSDWVNCIRFVSDRTLLSCSDDGTIKVWDLDTRQCVSTLTGHTHHVQWIHLLDDLHTHPSLSPSIRASDSASATDSSQPAPLPFAISASLDNTLRIWDLSTGRCIETLFGHVEGIWSVALDALRIASSSNDGEVKVWDTTSRKCIHTLKVSDSSVNCLTLSDTRIVCGDNEGVVTIYDFRNNK